MRLYMDRLVFIQQSSEDLITATLILKPEVIVLLRLCRPNCPTVWLSVYCFKQLLKANFHMLALIFEMNVDYVSGCILKKYLYK